MAKPFSVNVDRFDPYKPFRFLLYFGTSTTPVAGVSKVTGGLKRSSPPIEYKEGGNAVTLKGLGCTTYDPITLERGVTHDTDFEDWANAAQVLDKGSPSQSLKNLRREVRIDLLYEEGQAVQRYIVHRCWVSEYQALPDLELVAMRWPSSVSSGKTKVGSATDVSPSRRSSKRLWSDSP